MKRTLILTSAAGEASNVTYPMTLKIKKGKLYSTASSNKVEEPHEP